MITELLTQLEEHLATIRAHELEPGMATIEHAEPTQLRVAAHRLGMFIEHLEQLKVNHQPAATDLAELSRTNLNAKALEHGIEEPHKLPNKQAVLDAIHAAAEPAPEPQRADTAGTPAAESASGDVAADEPGEQADGAQSSAGSQDQ